MRRGTGTVIIDFNDSFTYNVYELLRRCGYRDYSVLGVGDLDSESFPVPSRIILSPGPGVPSDYPEVFRLLERLYGAERGRPGCCPDVPLLGICLGHQIVCSYAGASLYNLDSVVHGQPKIISCTDGSPLFSGTPDEFTVGLYHSWAVSKPLPDELKLTAVSEDGTVMSVLHRTFPIYGLQFHPESFISEYGTRLLTNFLNL